MFVEIDVKKVGEISNYWGDRMPMMAMEEAGELIQAISKVERKKTYEAKENLVEEIRDMYISLMALQYRYGITVSDIQGAINEKINMKKED